MALLGAETSKSVQARVSIVLESQPSCLEFANSHDILLVGTYRLETNESTQQMVDEDAVDTQTAVSVQQRSGSLLVFHTTAQTATLHQTKHLPYALLDLHFSPTNPSILAVATSVGSISFFSCDLDHGGDLNFIKSTQVCDASILVLSFAFNQPILDDVSTSLAVSLSNGHLTTFTDEQEDRDIITVPVHGQEAWTVAWSRADRTAGPGQVFLYSGGDDSGLFKHSTSLSLAGSKDEAGIDSLQVLGHDFKTHGAGVTAIVTIPFYHDGEGIVVTGSYDEYIRIIVPPMTGRARAKVLAERHLGGGVWRISKPFKYASTNSGDWENFKMLASCMHAGAEVLKIHRKADIWSIEVTEIFLGHESMNYASAYRESNESLYFVSTSFYDRRLCIWTSENASDKPDDGQD